MRILQLITDHRRRGAQVFAADLSEALASRSHDVAVAALYEETVSPLDCGQASVLPELGQRDRFVAPVLVMRLARTLAAFSPDVLQANGSDTLKFAVAARVLARTRTPIVYRNISLASRWLRGPLHRSVNRWLAHRPDHVVSVSHTSRDDFLLAYRIAANKVTVIPQATQVPATGSRKVGRDRIRAITGTSSGRVLVHIGNFSTEKNHEFLIRAFGEILSALPDATLLLIGDGPLRGEVSRRVQDAGLMDSVHFLGVRDDAREIAGGADALVLCSLVEGLPGVILEAAARGVPTVATDVGGVGEAIANQLTGVVTPPRDLAAFASAVLDLLNDEDRRAMMGRAARRRVDADYNLDRIASSYEALYDDLQHQLRMT
ncbi:MAG: glycosyltransferase [Acidobacteria bacterium]|nr:glycosyltransferase [Acidobacteriota bacterium]